MEQHAATYYDEAIAWRIRLRDADAAEWEEFVAWLEADPHNGAAYDKVAAADHALAAEAVPLARVPAANDTGEGVASSTRLRAIPAALAGAVAALLLIMFLVPRIAPSDGRYEVATAPGQQRTVTLAGGGAAALNGDTRLVLDRSQPRYAELVNGEATFEVRHDPARPFTVAVGNQRVTDVGTEFNLVRESKRLSVQVIEGAVSYAREGRTIALAAGQTLEARDGSSGVRVGRKDPSAMAGWRRGQLSYSATPLRIVASDLSRTLGTPIAVDPAVAGTPFTGSIQVRHDRRATLGELAAVAGLRLHRVKGGWRIGP